MRHRASFLVTAVSLAVASPALAAPVVTRLSANVYQNLYGVAADQHGVYVTGATAALRDFDTPGNGVIGLIPLAGGPVVTLYAAANYPSSSGHVAPLGIATDGNGNLVWADPDAGPSTGSSMFTGTWQGGTANQFFTTCCGPSAFPGDVVGVAITGATIVFSDSTSGGIGENPTGGSSTQIGATRFGPDFNLEMFSQIAATPTHVYVADSGEQVGAQSGTQVIFDRTASAGTGIRLLTPGTSTAFTTLTTAMAHPHGIAVVGNTLYVTSAHDIWRVNATTGAAKRLVHDKRFVDLQGVAFYKGTLYAADDQNVYGPFSSGVATATSDKPGVVWKIKL